MEIFIVLGSTLFFLIVFVLLAYLLFKKHVKNINQTMSEQKEIIESFQQDLKTTSQNVSTQLEKIKMLEGTNEYLINVLQIISEKETEEAKIAQEALHAVFKFKNNIEK